MDASGDGRTCSHMKYRRASLSSAISVSKSDAKYQLMLCVVSASEARNSLYEIQRMYVIGVVLNKLTSFLICKF